MLPGSRSDYRTTPAAVPWIMTGVAIGTLLLVLVFWLAAREADRMYEAAGYPKESKSIAERVENDAGPR